MPVSPAQATGAGALFDHAIGAFDQSWLDLDAERIPSDRHLKVATLWETDAAAAMTRGAKRVLASSGV